MALNLSTLSYKPWAESTPITSELVLEQQSICGFKLVGCCSNCRRVYNASQTLAAINAISEQSDYASAFNCGSCGGIVMVNFTVEVKHAFGPVFQSYLFHTKEQCLRYLKKETEGKESQFFSNPIKILENSDFSWSLIYHYGSIENAFSSIGVDSSKLY
jgi:hypothetical protein